MITVVAIADIEEADTRAFSLAAVNRGLGFDTMLNACRFPSIDEHATRALSCLGLSGNESKIPCSCLDNERLKGQKAL